ncbi:hypothetical protein QUA71_23605 [Microcoleus sp. MON1_C5]|uniref:hypothetical protein n=1 Tax=Microcoleus sp. MON1_C5 TaxID=2818828 RepID=UPI002FD42EF1
MPYSRGDVVLVLFPSSDLRTAKRRPASIVQANNLGTGWQSDKKGDKTSNFFAPRLVFEKYSELDMGAIGLSS